ncbi:hypothetical protein D3C76_1823000 [compost metagenome]
MSLRLSLFLLILDFQADVQSGYLINWMRWISRTILKLRRLDAGDCGLIRSRARVIFWLFLGILEKV